jgi:hypothetical protein
MQDAALMGLDMSQLCEVQDDEEDEAFELLVEGEFALICFERYLSREWIYGFNGIEGFNTLSALAVISRIKTKPKAQLRLLEQVGFIAAGALSYFNEQRDKK